jgi:hypothetical protein
LSGLPVGMMLMIVSALPNEWNQMSSGTNHIFRERIVGLEFVLLI